MKTTILMSADRTQLVLSPESEHDAGVVRIMEALPNCQRGQFYNCQGGWTREGSGRDDLLIVFDTAPKDPKAPKVPR